MLYFKVLSLFALIAAAAPMPGFADERDSVEQCIQQADAIDKKLRCLPEVDVKAVSADPSLPVGIKQFEIKFKQPIDHDYPSAGTFEQRLVLLHRSETEPMVLQTSGYSIFGIRQSTLMRTYDTNQLQVEHRFFSNSSPEPKDWSKLNIRQSAVDFHRITQAFKLIYKNSWVGTGASKGGMTSVYHRFFYPNDLDGTVADVAPLSYTTTDDRYIDFVDRVGGEKYADCREKLKQLQIKLLENRSTLVPTIAGEFDHLGSADLAFEHAVVESQFIFWQYKNPEDSDVGCDQIPVEGSPEEMLEYLQEINGLDGYTDEGLEGFLAYYFQAATELGNPGNQVAHLKSLLKYPFTIDQYTPKGVTYSYSNSWMHRVKTWIKEDARDIVFVYGEFDPWSAGAFPAGAEANNMHHFWVKGGNHGANFMQLDATQRRGAMAVISKWFKKDAVIRATPFRVHESLEELEFKVRQAKRL